MGDFKFFPVQSSECISPLPNIKRTRDRPVFFIDQIEQGFILKNFSKTTASNHADEYVESRGVGKDVALRELLTAGAGGCVTSPIFAFFDRLKLFIEIGA